MQSRGHAIGNVMAKTSIHDLATHPRAYVSVGELASYWGIGRKHIYKQLEAGTLEAIRLGPRLYRIRTCKAVEFERQARLARPTTELIRPQAASGDRLLGR
jgi:excisionase family DNA binding protein